MSQLPKVNLLLISQKINKLDFQPKKKTLDWITEARKKLQITNQLSEINPGEQKIKLSGKQLEYIDRQTKKLKASHIKLFRNFGVINSDWSHNKVKLQYHNLLETSRKLYQNQLTHEQFNLFSQRYNENNNNKEKNTIQPKQQQRRNHIQQLMRTRNRKYLDEFKESRYFSQKQRLKSSVDKHHQQKYFGKLVPKINFRTSTRRNSTIIYEQE